MPLQSLIRLTTQDYDDSVMNDFHTLLGVLLGKLEKDLEEVIDRVFEDVGKIEINRVKHGEILQFEGKNYHGGDLIRAYLSPKSPECMTEGDTKCT